MNRYLIHGVRLSVPDRLRKDGDDLDSELGGLNESRINKRVENNEQSHLELPVLLSGSLDLENKGRQYKTCSPRGHRSQYSS